MEAITDNDILIGLWEYGTREEALTEDVKEAAKIICQVSGASENSPLYRMAACFVLGLNEGMRVYHCIIESENHA